jgi:hypothetical protein
MRTWRGWRKQKYLHGAAIDVNGFYCVHLTLYRHSPFSRSLAFPRTGAPLKRVDPDKL